MLREIKLICFLNFLLLRKGTLGEELTLTVHPTHVVYKELGAGVYFSCTAPKRDSVKLTKMMWKNPSDKIIPPLGTSIITFDGAIWPEFQRDLLISKLKEKDVGIYKCLATYADNQTLEKTVEVASYSDIEFKDTKSLQTLKLHSDAKIRCVVTGNPAPLVKWYKNGTHIKESERIIIQNDGLLIKGITMNDEGVYRCRATIIQFGMINFKNIKVEVHFPPKISSPLKDAVGGISESVSLKCNATGKPAPLFTWMHNDSEIRNEKEGYVINDKTGDLKILDLKPEHIGKYQCIAENAVGSDFAVAKLKLVTQMPKPILSMEILKKGTTSISWTIENPLNDDEDRVLGYTVQFWPSFNTSSFNTSFWNTSQEKFWSKGSSYTIDNLKPGETYTFSIAARNILGNGNWSEEKTVQMKKKSSPEKPVILGVDPNRVKNIANQNQYDLQWQEPYHGGEPITSYTIIYYQVENSTSGWNPVGPKNEVRVLNSGRTNYRLEGLKSNSFYQIELRALNNIGFSPLTEPVTIKTKSDNSCNFTDVSIKTENFQRSFLRHLMSFSSNVFLRKPVNGSPIYFNSPRYQMTNAVDGDRETYYSSKSVSNLWFFVDLEEVYLIWEIRVTISGQNETAAFQIFFGNDIHFHDNGQPDVTQLPIFAFQPGSGNSLRPSATWTLRKPGGMCGRYVVLYGEAGNNYLIYELQGTGYAFH